MATKEKMTAAQWFGSVVCLLAALAALTWLTAKPGKTNAELGLRAGDRVVHTFDGSTEIQRQVRPGVWKTVEHWSPE